MNGDTEFNFDTLIIGQIEIKEKWQKVINEIEKRKALGNSVILDGLALAEAKTNIKYAEEAITQLNKGRAEFKTTVQSEEKASTIAEEKILIDNLIKKNNLGYLVKENKYAYCMGMEENKSNVVNPIFEFVEATKFGRVLNKMAGRQLKLGARVLADELADHFQKINKDYYMTTCSFNRDKWGKDKVYNKADIIRNFWIMPDFDNIEDYDPRFDFLLNCIGGGKQENINHLEQWIGFKYLYPEKVGNIPNLDIGGYPGGNGKGRFVELCKTIFTNPCIQPATLKELMDGFNGNWEMAVMLYYDEPAQDELPEGKLKQATGSEDLRIERKGVDATVADRNYSLVFISNNPNGVVKLAGTGSSGEDRRYSVLTTSLVMVDEIMKTGINIEDAKVYVNDINNLLKDRSAVAKWLAHIIMKHSIADMRVLQPLHGVDYKNRFGDQKSPIDSAFDLLLPVFVQNGIMPFEILKALMHTLTGYDKLSDKKIKMDWKRYLEKNKIANTYYDGNERIYFTYSWNNTNTVRVQRSCYVITETNTTHFNYSTVLKRTPMNLKLGKEMCESLHNTIFEDI